MNEKEAAPLHEVEWGPLREVEGVPLREVEGGHVDHPSSRRVVAVVESWPYY